MTLTLIILWLVSGALSFVYWWTKEYDFTESHIGILLIASTMGPIAFISGYSIHGKGRVIMKARK